MKTSSDDPGGLLEFFNSTRKDSLSICDPLNLEDHNVQAMPDVSPPKWHLAHTSWFFEQFILSQVPSYKVFDENFSYLFNSYYQSVGAFHFRPERALLSRPSLSRVMDYRRYVDQTLNSNWSRISSDTNLCKLLEVGIHHEKQHQELLLMDIKYNFFRNPLFPAYREIEWSSDHSENQLEWSSIEEGVYEVGHLEDSGFAYDNEGKRHRVYLQPVSLSQRLVTNAEYKEFVDSGAYSDPSYWLSDGWNYIQGNKQRHPLYWQNNDDLWREFTLAGLRELNPNEPVSHISYYEADAYARWSGCRLPTEFEWEVDAYKRKVKFTGKFLKELHSTDPSRLGSNLWQWTSSSYSAYPGFRIPPGAVGEYNGKFMCNQYVLRGGSYGSPARHLRISYRNFFPAHSQWMFSGIRLAKECF